MNILAIDLGTSSVRGLVLDGRAVPVPGMLARRPVEIALGDDGAATLDAPGYLAALIECLDELAEAGHLNGVELVATAAQWHSLVPLDRRGQSVGPVLTWLDTRPAPTSTGSGPADEEAYHQRTGTWWHRCYWSMRLPWLRERLGVRQVRFTGLVEYVLGQLLDAAPMSVSQASGTGLLDLGALDWDAEAVELAGVRPADLPQLAPADWRGRLRAAHARRWPALRDVGWAAPLGDGAASNIGAGCSTPTRAAVTVGTSAAVRLVQPAPPGADLPRLPYELWRYRVDHHHVVTGTAYSGGGNLYAWARRTLRLPEGEELAAALAEVPPGGGIPADARLGGDRPPGLAPAGYGRFSGIGFDSSAVEMFAGLMDALCRQVSGGVEQLESSLDCGVDVVLGGGAVAASAWWRQAFVVTLAPRPVYYMSNPEIGATGAALVAIGQLDGAAGLEHIVRTDKVHSATATRSAHSQYPS